MSMRIHRFGVLQSASAGGGATNSRKAELTVQEATPAGFETLIDENVIGALHDFWSHVQADGGDIRFYTDSALTNRLPLEVEAINVGGHDLPIMDPITRRPKRA